MKIAYKRPFLYSYQKQILNATERYTITEAATKVGKTASHIIWLFEEALKCKNNQSVWWVAPTYSQAEIAFKRMKAQITNKNFFKANETKLTLTLPTGAIIQFKSAEKPDNLYGDDVYAAVFDEFTRAREEAWFALRSTLTKTNGRCKFIGNVKGKKNWGYRLALKAKAGEQNFKHFKITAYDAVAEGLLSLEEIESAKRELPEHVFNELYMAEPADDGSNPFGERHIQSCITTLSTQQPFVYGVDLAKSVDYTAIIGLDATGKVCKLERFQKDWLQTKNEINRIVGRLPCLIDSTGVGDGIVEDIQRSCPNVEGFKFTSNSKQQIMEGLATAIQSGSIGFPAGIIPDELMTYEFEYTRTGVRYTAPSGVHDDTVCAIALAYKKFTSSARVGTYMIA